MSGVANHFSPFPSGCTAETLRKQSRQLRRLDISLSFHMYDVTIFMLVPNLFVVSRITYSNHNNSCWCNISHNTLQCPGPPARFQVRDVSYTNRLNNGKDLRAVAHSLHHVYSLGFITFEVVRLSLVNK